MPATVTDVTETMEVVETTEDIEVEEEDMSAEPINIELVKKLQATCILLV